MLHLFAWYDGDEGGFAICAERQVYGMRYCGSFRNRNDLVSLLEKAGEKSATHYADMLMRDYEVEEA